MLEETEYRNLHLGTILRQFRSFLNLSCCFSEIKLCVILTSPSIHSCSNFAIFLHRNEFSSCTFEPHTRQSQVSAMSAQYLVTCCNRYVCSLSNGTDLFPHPSYVHFTLF